MTTSPPTHDTIEALRAVAADLATSTDAPGRLAHTICLAVEATLRRELLAEQLRRVGITG